MEVRRSRDIEERKHGAVMSVQCPGLLLEPFLRKLTMMADYLRYLDPTEARTRIEATNLPQYKVQGSISFH